MILYRMYKYSVLATLFSAFSFTFAFLGVVGAISLFSAGSIVGGILCAAIGVCCGYEYFTHKIADNIARKNGKKNIETKARYGKMYVEENPEQYDYVISKNEAFAQKFVRDEATGKIVKRR